MCSQSRIGHNFDCLLKRMSGLQQNSLLSISQEKMANFINGGYSTNRFEQVRLFSIANILEAYRKTV